MEAKVGRSERYAAVASETGAGYIGRDQGEGTFSQHSPGYNQVDIRG